MKSDYSVGLHRLLAGVGAGALEFLLFMKGKFKLQKQSRTQLLTTSTLRLEFRRRTRAHRLYRTHTHTHTSRKHSFFHAPARSFYSYFPFPPLPDQALICESLTAKEKKKRWVGGS